MHVGLTPYLELPLYRTPVTNCQLLHAFDDPDWSVDIVTLSDTLLQFHLPGYLFIMCVCIKIKIVAFWSILVNMLIVNMLIMLII